MKSIWNVLTVLLTFAYFAFILVIGQGKQVERITDANAMRSLAIGAVVWFVSIAVCQIIKAIGEKKKPK